MKTFAEILETEKGQKIYNFCYGTGAAIVILGALFKILHLPGASGMLLVGMSVEAVLFFGSALENPHKSYHWENVYPELVTRHSTKPVVEKPKVKAANAASQGINQNLGGGDLLAQLQASGQLSAEDIKKLADAIRNLGETATNINELGSASVVTKGYVENLDKASHSISQFSDVQTESANQIKQTTQDMSGSIKTLSAKMQETLTETIKSSSAVLSESASELTSAYKKVSNSLTNDFDTLKSDSEDLQKELSGINKNLAAINSVYELQLNKAKEQLKIKDEQLQLLLALNKGYENANENVTASIVNSKEYRDQTVKLSKQITELNGIYGNMLNALVIN